MEDNFGGKKVLVISFHVIFFPQSFFYFMLPFQKVSLKLY